MNDSACLELLTQYKDRYKFSSHTFISADIPDGHHITIGRTMVTHNEITS